MDFCACDHCRSILSPAAYLVDLLLFLNSDPDDWAAYLSAWKTDHGNAPYPFADPSAWAAFQIQWNQGHPGQALPNTEVSPFEVLMSRRPDIQHLPLTCENTNTAIPYIDLVNETMEYFVANTARKFSLEGYKGHDTGAIASEDLLASPQYVMDAAYATLGEQRFPSPLPFHQPLETLRRCFNAFEVPLALAMERLRMADGLERGGNPYGWRDIWMEELSLSRAEYEILTDSSAVPLWRAYGFPTGTADADVVAGLGNAKEFARRVGVTYDELISLLRTRFINPDSDLIPKLERLGVNFTMLAPAQDEERRGDRQEVRRHPRHARGSAGSGGLRRRPGRPEDRLHADPELGEKRRQLRPYHGPDHARDPCGALDGIEGAFPRRPGPADISARGIDPLLRMHDRRNLGGGGTQVARSARSRHTGWDRHLDLSRCLELFQFRQSGFPLIPTRARRPRASAPPCSSACSASSACGRSSGGPSSRPTRRFAPSSGRTWGSSEPAISTPPPSSTTASSPCCRASAS
jgi:hypothetical protein